MRKLRAGVDEVMQSIGIKKKIVLACESKTRKYARRSLVANSNLKKGHIIKEKDLIPKRPGTGIPPNKINEFIGKKIKRSLLADEFINLKDI